MKTQLIALALAAGLALPAVAQTAAPGAPLTAEQFRQEATFSDTFEIQSSRLALERSQNAAIRQYAQTMVTDHSKTTQMLQSMPGAASSATSSPPAGGLVDPRRAQMLQRLEAANGPAFDALYAQMQVMAHREAVQMFTSFAQSGQDQNLRSFATQALPTLQAHLNAAQQLATQVSR